MLPTKKNISLLRYELWSVTLCLGRKLLTVIQKIVLTFLGQKDFSIAYLVNGQSKAKSIQFYIIYFSFLNQIGTYV